MARGFEERLMFVLPVELDESRRKFLEGGGRCEFAVDERAAPAAGADLAPDNQLVSVAFEDGLDGGALLASSDEVSRGSAAEQQAHRLNEDGLACPGFACQDIQAGIELDFDGVDDRQAPNPEKTQHGGRRNSNRNIGLTGFSQRDTVLRIALSQRRTSSRSGGPLRTLGSPVLALLMQAQGSGLSGGSGTNPLELIANSGIVAKIVLLSLSLMSIFCWAIIFYKLWTFRRADRQSGSFLEVFRRSNKFSEVQAVCRSLSDSPLVGLFQAGYAELSTQLRQSPTAEEPMSGANPRAGAARPMLKSLAAVDRALMRASTVEMNKLESRISFLATTASIAPFVGLFGTVWGIMEAFLAIGEQGSTSLGVVAPGIAEALITTAAGLAAAIPAVIAYNQLSHRVKQFASQMDDFAMEFLNISERNFT